MTVLDSEKLINLIWKNCFSINSHFMNNPIMAQIINTAIASSAEDLLGPNKIGKFSLDEMTGGGGGGKLEFPLPHSATPQVIN